MKGKITIYAEPAKEGSSASLVNVDMEIDDVKRIDKLYLVAALIHSLEFKPIERMSLALAVMDGYYVKQSTEFTGEAAAQERARLEAEIKED